MILRAFRFIASDFLADNGAAVHIMQRLDYLPLAISQAASYISKVGVSNSEYLKLIDSEIERQMCGYTSSLAALQTIPDSVRDLWETSLGRLEAYDPPAVYLLHMCACFACENISVEMLFLGMSQSLQLQSLQLRKYTDIQDLSL